MCRHGKYYGMNIEKFKTIPFDDIKEYFKECELRIYYVKNGLVYYRAEYGKFDIIGTKDSRDECNQYEDIEDLSNLEFVYNDRKIIERRNN